jgi:membrane associated rhomboid family serine protease
MVYFFYYFPVGINAKLRRFPVSTWAYGGLCLLIFVMCRYFPGRVPFEFGRLVYFPDQGTWVTAVGAAFLHLGYFHLIGNLVYLLLFGRYVEDRMGGVLFSTIFVGCAGIGNILQGVFNTYVLDLPDVGIVGASGAVSGLLGAFTVRFLASKLQIAYWVFMPLQAFTRAGKAEIPVIFAVGFWFLMEFTRGLLQAGGIGTQVAYIAHVSGFLVGGAAALVSGQLTEGRVEALLRRAADYLRKGEPYAAQGDYIRYLTYRPGDPEVHAELARAMVLTRDIAGARENYRKACELLVEQKRRGESEALYQEAVRGIGDFTLGAEYQLGLAFGLERDLKPKLAVHAYEMFAGKYPDHSESAFALLRAAGIHLNALSDLEAADRLYERLLQNYPQDVWADFTREQRRKLGCQRV